jgi:hypothetical protein
MYLNLKCLLRSAILALTWAALLCPFAAQAYVSNGSDGQFHPTVSTVLDATHTIFNFTDIIIPSGVIVSFSGLAAAQPLELLAMGDIGIAGTVNAGLNNLWIETPGTLIMSGSLNTSGNAIVLVANTLDFSGTVDIQNGQTGSGAGTLPGGSGGISSCSGDCASLSPVPEPGVWTMLLLGLAGLFIASRTRFRNICVVEPPYFFCGTWTKTSPSLTRPSS